jgi:hypothetical protein
MQAPTRVVSIFVDILTEETEETEADEFTLFLIVVMLADLIDQHHL